MKKHGNIQSALRCMDNADFEKKIVNDNNVLDVIINF